MSPAASSYVSRARNGPFVSTTGFFSAEAGAALASEGDFRVAPFAWMVAGGPFASLMLALIGAAGWYLYGADSE